MYNQIQHWKIVDKEARMKITIFNNDFNEIFEEPESVTKWFTNHLTVIFGVKNMFITALIDSVVKLRKLVNAGWMNLPNWN